MKQFKEREEIESCYYWAPTGSRMRNCTITFHLEWLLKIQSLRFWRLISWKRAESSHRLLLNTNGKSYSQPILNVRFDIQWNWNLWFKFPDIWSHLILERSSVCLLLLVNTNRQLHLDSPFSRLNLILSDLERSLISQALVSHNIIWLNDILLLLNTNRNSYI